MLMVLCNSWKNSYEIFVTSTAEIPLLQFKKHIAGVQNQKSKHPNKGLATLSLSCSKFFARLIMAF